MGAIIVKDLGKAYKKYPTRWTRLVEWLSPFSKPLHVLHWVIKDISFDVQPGEAVGIIGINGAGKSTLLKMITGTTQPTVGSVNMNGRVAALLELGMGFHPDFTGRQNALMAGQLLGYSVKEIELLMPEIEAFAEIGEYIDQPVRVYSSGMQVRLAFSVATAIRPDILIIDEALSVGDAYFQHKSFDRIRDFRGQGTTLLLVSHDKSAIQSICDRAILLSQGCVAIEGVPEVVMDYYNAMLADRQNQEIGQLQVAFDAIQTISGNQKASIINAQICEANGTPLGLIKVGQLVTLEVEISANTPVKDMTVGFMIKDRLGLTVFGTNTHHHRFLLKEFVKEQKFLVSFEFNANIGPGIYSVSLALHSGGTHLDENFEWRDQALKFEVINIGLPEFSGVAWLPVGVRCSR